MEYFNTLQNAAQITLGIYINLKIIMKNVLLLLHWNKSPEACFHKKKTSCRLTFFKRKLYICFFTAVFQICVLEQMTEFGARYI